MLAYNKSKLYYSLPFSFSLECFVQLHAKDKGTTGKVWLYLLKFFIVRVKNLETAYNITPNSFY